MKRVLITLCAIATTTILCAQPDTTLNRVVTVESDFQPIIQNVNKINQTPTIIEKEQQLNPVVYSTYSPSLPIDFNVHTLQVAETNFSSAQSPLQGVIDGAIGHRNTHLNFKYRIAEKKKMSLDLFAKHDAMWGRQTLSNSQLGLQITRHFSTLDLYFGVDGNNEYYSRYGRYYDGDKGLTIKTIKDMAPSDWQNSWLLNTCVGIRSRGDVPVRYKLQTGYSAYILPNAVTEHQIRTLLNATWVINTQHQAGLNAYVQDNMYSVNDSLHLSTDSYNARHAFRLEPYYAYTGDKFRIHTGVNFDFNLGAGYMMSAREDISFAPSPNVSLEWFLMKDILDLYIDAKGQFGTSSLLEYMQTNRYMEIMQGITSHHVDDYTPIDAQLGFKIRPMETMLLDIYAGYAYQMNQLVIIAPTKEKPLPYLDFVYSDFQRWKVGAKLHYHYRDILNIHLAGNYYYWTKIQQEKTIDNTESSSVFDRPSWDASLRIDVRIDQKWSLYSDNLFIGSRKAYTTNGEMTLKPIIALNIGGAYSFNRWLSTYIQLNNYLNRSNDIYYGYQSEGCNFLWGVKYLF